MFYCIHTFYLMYCNYYVINVIIKCTACCWTRSGHRSVSSNDLWTTLNIALHISHCETHPVCIQDILEAAAFYYCVTLSESKQLASNCIHTYPSVKIVHSQMCKSHMLVIVTHILYNRCWLLNFGGSQDAYYVLWPAVLLINDFGLAITSTQTGLESWM